jgi:hypothetical protein
MGSAMKVYLIAGSVFEARDLGRMLGLPVQETVILNSAAAAKLQRPQDGDLILETASACEHIEYAGICEALQEKTRGLDVRWETEDR